MTYDNWKLATPDDDEELYEDPRFPVSQWNASGSRLGYLEWLEDEEHNARARLYRSLYGRSYRGDPEDPRDDVREDYHEAEKADYDRDGGDDD